MTREHALAELAEWERDGDTERAHVEADDILCALLTTLGYADVVAAYDRIGKWFA